MLHEKGLLPRSVDPTEDGGTGVGRTDLRGMKKKHHGLRRFPILSGTIERIRATLFFPLLLSLAGCAHQLGLPLNPPPTEIRVATYNTHFFGKHDASHPDGKDSAAVLADIAQLTTTLGIDVWMFQEAYRSLAPNPNPYPTNHLQRILEVLPGWQGVYSQMKVEGAFSKGTIIAWNALMFEPVGLPIALQWQAGNSTSDPKGGVAQILRRLQDSKEVLIVCVHFDTGVNVVTRKKQAQEAVAKLTSALTAYATLLQTPPAQLPWIFGGDLNTAFGRSEPCYRYLVNDLGMDSAIDFTVRTHIAGMQLDHLLAKGLSALGADVRYEANDSDHFPVIASFDLP